MHHDHLVLVGRYDARARGVGGDPALLLADVYEHGVDALLGAGAGVEVVGEDLVYAYLRAAAVHDDLLSAEVRVPEGRRGVDDGAGLEVLDRADVDEGLQLRHGEAEEGRVARADQEAVVAVVVAAGLEGHQDELLAREPAEGLRAQLVEAVAVDVLEAGLIRVEPVAYAHTVRVAAAHIVLGEVYGRAVLASHDLGLLDGVAVDVVEHLYLIRVLVAEDELEELILARRYNDAGAVVYDLPQRLGEFKAFKEYVQLSCLTFCLRNPYRSRIGPLCQAVDGEFYLLFNPPAACARVPAVSSRFSSPAYAAAASQGTPGGARSRRGWRGRGPSYSRA